ncbi:MAG: M20/M25/M40 family metallo-hydrolase [Silvibacterium sp.]|nr:M20/M25/M40 family metallo-hydrolase [Silvibacterium sp.]
MRTLPALLLSATLSLGSFSAGLAQNPPSSTTALTLDAKLKSDLVRLGGHMMIEGQAYEYDRHLADDIGPRLTGSANYVKAVAWAEGEFKRLGLANVHRESWEIPATWEPETLATARIIAPHEQRLHLESEGWSPSTPAGGVRGEVYYLDELSADAVKARADKIKDKIVLMDGPSVMAHIDEGFGKLFDALNLLAGDGAKALVLGFGTTNDAPNFIGYTNFTGSLANIPTGNLGQEDTLLLKRMLERGPVEIEFSFTNRIRRNVQVQNVIADVPGRESNGEYVIVAGHLDSWHPGTGAQDNGTGAATVLAVAQAVKASGLTPRRTMRFILFGGEEEGLLGSIHYAREHAADAAKCAGVFVTDSGGEPPKGWLVFGRKDEANALGVLKPYLEEVGAAGTSNDGEYTFSTDEAPFLVQGVPSFVLWTETEKYETLHHKPSDTFDKVNQRDLNLGAAVVGMTAFAFADAPESLKHLSTAELENQLKDIKALTQYKDMQDHKLF